MIQRANQTLNELVTDPEVSVIVAIKNSERFLSQALASIVAQSFKNYEIIVVDGDSRDNGPAIARSYPRTVCIPQNGTGFAHAWNVGFAASRGRFITFLDSDDLWTPDKLKSQLAMFQRNPVTEYVFGRIEFFLEPGTSLPKGFRSTALVGSLLGHMTGAAMIRRDVMERMGPFEVRWQIAGDIAWFSLLRDSSILGIVDEVLLRKRLHEGNLSHTTAWPILKSELFQVLKERVDRSRLARGVNNARADNAAVDLDTSGDS